MKVILFFLLSLAYSAPVLAQKCSTQLSNAPNAIIESYTDWWDQGQNGFSWQTYIDGVQFDEYGAERLPNDGPCMNYCTPFRFVAKSYNVRIDVQVVSGNASGWKCAQPSQVVGYWQDSIMFVALSQADKDQLSQDAAKMGQAARYFALLAATAKSFGGDQVSTLIAQLATAASLGSKWAQIYLEAEAADPWDDEYGSPFDAPLWSAAQLGFEYCSGDGAVPAYCNALADTIARIEQMGDGAYVSLNRSSTCAQVGNSDCAKWQGDRSRWYLRQQGEAMRDAGYYLWVLRDNLANDVYSPECDCWLSQALGQAAGDFWNNGSYLANLN